MRRAIESAIGTVPFTAPISVVYCVALRGHLLTALPGASVDVYHRIRELIVEARHGKSACKVVVPLQA